MSVNKQFLAGARGAFLFNFSLARATIVDSYVDFSPAQRARTQLLSHLGATSGRTLSQNQSLISTRPENWYEHIDMIAFAAVSNFAHGG